MPDETVSATEASRHFARLLRAVEEGGRITIAKDGRAVAVLAPAGEEPRHVSAAVLDRFDALARRGLAIGFTGGIDRDALHRR
jgi:prevent-host-death family protein